MLSKNIEIRERALDKRLRGMAFEAISQDMGISRQRAYELLVPPSILRKIVYDRAKGKCEVCSVPLGRNGHYHSHPCSTYDDFSRPTSLLCLACHIKEHKGGDAIGRKP